MIGPLRRRNPSQALAGFPVGHQFIPGNDRRYIRNMLADAIDTAFLTIHQNDGFDHLKALGSGPLDRFNGGPPGGSDIVEELYQSGELQKMIAGIGEQA